MTNWKHIKYSFEKVIGVDTVGRVNIVDRRAGDGNPYQSAFIQFRRWPKTQRATAILERLTAGGRINVVYDECSPCFWRCSLARP